MPLIKLFTRSGTAALPAAEVLHKQFQQIWQVPGDVMKVMVIPVADWSESFEGESVYVDVRAKKKPDRTPEVVNHSLQEMGRVLASYGHAPNIRVELYDPPLQFAWKPSKVSAATPIVARPVTPPHTCSAADTDMPFIESTL
mmetsp:Transcript_34360/g.65663  ORF Transcript_34360/g.65663 Transcript_34360/m.65663 type:complete len:142 (-) Transcript_34360:60-485(-)